VLRAQNSAHAGRRAASSRIRRHGIAISRVGASATTVERAGWPLSRSLSEPT
jgi:hypothetical protein